MTRDRAELPADIARLLGRLRDALLERGGPGGHLPAEAVLTTGDLITKSEAIGRLPGFGVPASLAGQIRRRRDGQDVTLGGLQRVRRAYLAWRLMKRGIRRLGRLGR